MRRSVGKREDRRKDKREDDTYAITHTLGDVTHLLRASC